MLDSVNRREGVVRHFRNEELKGTGTEICAASVPVIVTWILSLSLATVPDVFAKVQNFCGLLPFCLIVFCRTVTTKPSHVTLNA